MEIERKTYTAEELTPGQVLAEAGGVKVTVAEPAERLPFTVVGICDGQPTVDHVWAKTARNAERNVYARHKLRWDYWDCCAVFPGHIESLHEPL